jgi:hypothetical protein
MKLDAHPEIVIDPRLAEFIDRVVIPALVARVVRQSYEDMQVVERNAGVTAGKGVESLRHQNKNDRRP